MAQVVVEVVGVVGQRGRAVGGTAVGEHQQQAPTVAALYQPTRGPEHRFAVHPFSEQIAVTQASCGVDFEMASE